LIMEMDKECENTDIDINFYTTRKRCTDEPLAWDHMNSRIIRNFLWKNGANPLKKKQSRTVEKDIAINVGFVILRIFNPCSTKLKSAGTK
jgi:hypothetical protein